MKIDKGKSKLSTIALILVLAISATLVALPAASAQQTKATFCYLGVIPNPVGVNQPVLLHVGITDSRARQDLGWEGMTVTVEDPEGVESTLNIPKTDATGGTGYLFNPTKVGTYILQAHFPEQMVEVLPFFWGAPYNMTYLGSDSPVAELDVLDQALPYYPGHSLPSEYWTRPIDPQLREWSTVAGSWLNAPRNLYAPYNDGPETAHILWTKPMTSGGLVGGELGGHSFEIGDAYEGKWTGSSGGPLGWLSTAIIVAGNLYYQESTLDPPVVTHCVNLRTGEELWSKVFLDNQTIDFGQLFYWDAFNMHGTFAYLWVTAGGGGWWDPSPAIWYAFDAYTGDWVMTYEDVPSGNNIYGPNGEIFKYSISGGMVSLWNSTKVVMDGIGPPDSGSWGDNAHGRTHNASRGIEWTKPISETGLPGSVQVEWFEDVAIGASASTTAVSVWGISLKPGEEGTVLFNNSWTPPAYWAEGNVTVSGFGGGWVAWSQEDKVGILWIKETQEHYGFSLETGEYLWGPSESQYYLDALDDTHPESRAIAYGMFYCASVSGIIYCYDITTGELLWDYPVDDPYKEILWANNWWQKPVFITDGKIYTGHLEHSPTDPRARGGPFVCLDAYTGDLIWRAAGMFRQTRWGGRAIIGDSVIATMDTYDQRVYAIGKGPSATTVSAPETTQSVGTPVLIQGTVMDVSPGTEDIKLRMRFPNGVPAISDADMTDWMKYVYKQFEIPGDATGVEVVFNAVDSNGVWHDIDRTTTDMSGSFSYRWTPGTEGKYTIVATFMGSGGYYGSYAETAVSVGPAPEGYPGYQGPSADEIAQKTISQLPAYPDVPSAGEVAQETVSQLPAYPDVPSAGEVAQETISQLPETPAYLTIDLAIIAAVVIAIIIGLYSIVKKQK
jgi:hypothetical protein